MGSVRALVVVFALAGFFMAQAVSRMPTLRDQVDASTARLGLALLAVGVGSMVAMPWTARLTDRFGSAAVVGVTGVLAAGRTWTPTPPGRARVVGGALQDRLALLL